jgi:hypothetical protein
MASTKGRNLAQCVRVAGGWSGNVLREGSEWEPPGEEESQGACSMRSTCKARGCGHGYTGYAAWAWLGLQPTRSMGWEASLGVGVFGMGISHAYLFRTTALRPWVMTGITAASSSPSSIQMGVGPPRMLAWKGRRVGNPTLGRRTWWMMIMADPAPLRSTCQECAQAVYSSLKVHKRLRSTLGMRAGASRVLGTPVRPGPRSTARAMPPARTLIPYIQ